MKAKAAAALAIAVLTLLTYFQFPGHSYLTQDTQIYVPILEHLWNPSVLTRDILVQQPHVAFTVYDEVALALQWLTHAGFHDILAAQQLVFRGLGLWGIYLVAISVLASTRLALLTAAIFALGAEVPGPAVLVTEYEPSPRAFAIPLIFLAIGLIAHRRYKWAGAAAALAFVYHPPSAIAFYAALIFIPHARVALWSLPVAVALLLLAAHFQVGIHERQVFFSRVTPQLEFLQRLRAPYNWVSIWWPAQWKQYALVGGVCCAALWRIRLALSPEISTMFLCLVGIGIVSIPTSFLLLEILKWGLMPQLQPTRMLLFVIAVAVLSSSLAACAAARAGRWIEAFAWFAFTFAVPMHARIDTLPTSAVALTAVLLALIACASVSHRLITPVAVLAGFFAIPVLAHIHNYPRLDTPDLRALSAWARTATPRDAVFLFPAPPKNLEPGVFRSEALRAIYVDWKGGGQVNYLKDLGEEWWSRYQATVLLTPIDLPEYARLGIDFVVLQHPLERPAVFSNGSYSVYRTAP